MAEKTKFLSKKDRDTLNTYEAQYPGLVASINETGKIPSSLENIGGDEGGKITTQLKGIAAKLQDRKVYDDYIKETADEEGLTDDELQTRLEAFKTIGGIKGQGTAFDLAGFANAIKPRIRAAVGGIAITEEAINAVANFTASRVSQGTFSGQNFAEIIKDTNPGGVSPTDFEALKETGNRLGGEFAQDVPKFYTTVETPAQDVSADVKRIGGLIRKRKTDAAEQGRIDSLLQLAAGQREESGKLFGTALEAFQKPLPTFTPEFSAEVLDEIASRIAAQGETGREQTVAEQAKRGLTGSSVEAFALSEQEANTVDSLRQATFDFLLKSGEAGQRNREFLAQSLFQQAQTLLGAGLQTEGMAIGKEQFQASNILNQQQLAAQIAQFNQQMQFSREQFKTQTAFKEKELQSNMDLFNKYINTKSSGGMGIGEILGLTFQGIGAVGGALGGGGALLSGISSLSKE